MRRLDKKFFTGEDVVRISKDLLGKFLVTRFDDQTTAGMIVETEAYRGPDDKACHAWMNRRTNRTEVMFAEGGRAYVYLCYGIHHLFNVVTGKEDMPHAVLIRAVEPAENLSLMMDRRNMQQVKRQLTAGPGVLSQALGIHTEHTGASLVSDQSPIWIEDRGIQVSEDEVIASPRVGVEYAGECKDWPWRFRIKGSKWTSKAR